MVSNTVAPLYMSQLRRGFFFSYGARASEVYWFNSSFLLSMGISMSFLLLMIVQLPEYRSWLATLLVLIVFFASPDCCSNLFAQPKLGRRGRGRRSSQIVLSYAWNLIFRLLRAGSPSVGSRGAIFNPLVALAKRHDDDTGAD